MKKFLSVIFVLLLLCGLCACGDQETELTQLGTSGLYIAVPEGYAPCEDDFAEDQVAYFYKDDDSIDFDVYQWESSEEYTLESEAEYYAEQYGTTASAIEINGIKGMKYLSEEEFDGAPYTVLNYMFDDGKYLVEVCFWTINTAEEISAAEEIINTLTQK